LPSAQNPARDASAGEALLRLFALTRAFGDLYFRLDAGGVILDYHAPREGDLYLPPSEFLNRKMQDLLPPEAANPFLKWLEKLQNNRETSTIEYSLPMPHVSSQRLSTKNSSTKNSSTDEASTELRVRHFQARLVPLPENHIALVARDVTDLKNTEAVLRETEAKFRGIFEHAVEGIFQTTREGKYLSANPALAQIYGYATPRELMDGVTDIGRQLYLDPNRRKEFVLFSVRIRQFA